MTICFVPYCNAEGYRAVMMYYFSSKYSKKPFCRAILHACEIHARQLAGEDVIVKIKRMQSKYA